MFFTFVLFQLSSPFLMGWGGKGCGAYVTKYLPGTCWLGLKHDNVLPSDTLLALTDSYLYINIFFFFCPKWHVKSKRSTHVLPFSNFIWDLNNYEIKSSEVSCKIKGWHSCVVSCHFRGWDYCPSHGSPVRDFLKKIFTTLFSAAFFSQSWCCQVSEVLSDGLYNELAEFSTVLLQVFC